MSTDLDGVIGLCRFCGESLGEMAPPACATCAAQEKSRITNYREKDPYKKVWNSVEDEEGELLAWVKNGTLFIPTWEELARRYIAKSRSLLSQARKQESNAAGRKLFQDAMIYRNMAEKAFEEHRKVLACSR